MQVFLDSHAREWHDLNVPERDGKLLYDITIRNNYKRALEIGTSTGHSAIWIAWALSKTGGKLVTVEIDEARYNKALDNFNKAGLSEYIDARLADAHELVPNLRGPFDFVFSDVPDRRRNAFGLGSYVDYIGRLENFETIYFDSGAGVSISYMIREQ